jgi:hypothetical protein
MSVILFAIIRRFFTNLWSNNMKKSWSFLGGQFRPKLGGQFAPKLVVNLTVFST